MAKIGELLDPDVTQGKRMDLEDETFAGVRKLDKDEKARSRKIARIKPDTRLRYYDSVEKRQRDKGVYHCIL